MKAKLLIIYLLFICFISINLITVSTVEDLVKALGKARAGQIIAIAPGVYDFSEYERKSEFSLYSSGTKSSPITLTAQDPDNPPLLKAPTIKDGFIIHIKGDYWVIENIRIGYGGQAIVLDNASYNIIRNVEMFSLGSQAVLIRYGSSYNLFQNCYIHNTGNNNPIYADGFDIGLPHSEKTTGSDHIADNNVIEGCVFRNIASEPIKIREYTSGNEVVNNAFFGGGINGKNNADNFISISGSDNYIHNNVFHRNFNKYIVAAFEIKKLFEDSGDGNKFENNILFMDRPYGEIDSEKRMYVVDGADAQFSVKNNKVDYGNGLLDANSKEFYNSELVNFLE